MWFLYLVGGLVALIGALFVAENIRVSRLSPEDREKHFVALAEQQKFAAEMKEMAAKAKAESERRDGSFSTILSHGSRNHVLKCQHCDEKGFVHTKSVQRKAGISGGKATGALLTGGVSLLATGLSRKEKLTEAYCDRCKSVWAF